MSIVWNNTGRSTGRCGLSVGQCQPPEMQTDKNRNGPGDSTARLSVGRREGSILSGIKLERGRIARVKKHVLPHRGVVMDREALHYGWAVAGTGQALTGIGCICNKRRMRST
jgi:hypothetical protein